MRHILLPLLLTGVCASPSFGQSRPAELPDLVIGEHVFARRQLANGLRAVAIQDEGDTATVFMAVSTGNRDETVMTTGLAHLTEHAMFAGTATTGTDVHEKTIVAWGGESNAFTRDDYTMYYDHRFPPSELSRVLKMEADRLRNLALDEAPTLHERHRLDLEEEHSYQPSAGRAEQLENAVFMRHPYRHGLRDEKGHTKAIALSVADIRNFYDAHYHPNRVAVVVVGPTEPQAALAAIEAAFGSLPMGPKAPKYAEPRTQEPRKVTIPSELRRDRQVRCWLTPEMGHSDRPALAVLAALLGREDLPCGVPLSVGMGERVDSDLIQLSWSTGGDQAAQVAREVDALLESYRSGAADMSALTEVKELLSTSFVDEPLRARPYFALAGTVAWHESHHEAEHLATYQEQVMAVEAADITRVAKTWLPDGRDTTVVFQGTGEDVAPLPTDHKALQAAASEAVETGDMERALEAYGMLLDTVTDNMFTVIYYAERGGLYMEIKDFDSAIHDFEAALDVIDYPAVRDMLEEAHARKARAMRGVFEGEDEAPAEEDEPAANPHAPAAEPHGTDPRPELQASVDNTMRELEAWRGLKFTDQVTPEFVDAADSPDESLGGWYESDTKRLVVVIGKEGKGAAFTRGVQLHEIFHALQDQNWGLADLHASCSTVDDNRALSGLIEGEAMLAVSDLMNYDFAQHTKIPAEGEITRAKFEKLFNYGTGLTFVKAIREAGGWEAVNQVWQAPPRSTAQLYHPERFTASAAGEGRVRFTLAIAPKGKVHETDVKGEFELRWLLVEDAATRQLADPLGAALVSDKWFVVTPPEADHRHQVWSLVFATESDAELFAGATEAFDREDWTMNMDGRRVTLTREDRP